MTMRIIYGWHLEWYLEGSQWALRNPETDEAINFKVESDACKYAADHKIEEN